MEYHHRVLCVALRLPSARATWVKTGSAPAASFSVVVRLTSDCRRHRRRRRRNENQSGGLLGCHRIGISAKIQGHVKIFRCAAPELPAPSTPPQGAVAERQRQGGTERTHPGTPTPGPSFPPDDSCPSSLPRIWSGSMAMMMMMMRDDGLAPSSAWLW